MNSKITFPGTTSGDPADALNFRTCEGGIVIDTEGEDTEQVITKKEALQLYLWLGAVLGIRS